MGKLFRLFFLLAFFYPFFSFGDIAVFQNGRIMKINDFIFQGKDITLKILGGGEITVSRDSVYRILRNEIEVEENITRQYIHGNTPYNELIVNLSKKYNINSDLVKAVIKVESDFNANAVSVDNARGLMQLLPSTAGDYGITDLFDPESNLEAGIQHLKWLFSQLGEKELEKVLAAYNAGLNAVKRYGGVPPYKETQNYVKRILSIYLPPSGE